MRSTSIAPWAVARPLCNLELRCCIPTFQIRVFPTDPPSVAQNPPSPNRIDMYGLAPVSFPFHCLLCPIYSGHPWFTSFAPDLSKPALVQNRSCSHVPFTFSKWPRNSETTGYGSQQMRPVNEAHPCVSYSSAESPQPPAIAIPPQLQPLFQTIPLLRLAQFSSI